MGEELDDRELANHILLALPRATLQRLRPHLAPVVLERGQVIYHSDAAIKKIYFVTAASSPSCGP